MVGGVRQDANGNQVKEEDQEGGRRVFPNSPGEIMEMAQYIRGSERFADEQEQALALEQAALEAAEMEDGILIPDPKPRAARGRKAVAPEPALGNPGNPSTGAPPAKPDTK